MNGAEFSRQKDSVGYGIAVEAYSCPPPPQDAEIAEGASLQNKSTAPRFRMIKIAKSTFSSTNEANDNGSA